MKNIFEVIQAGYPSSFRLTYNALMFFFFG